MIAKTFFGMQAKQLHVKENRDQTYLMVSQLLRRLPSLPARSKVLRRHSLRRRMGEPWLVIEFIQTADVYTPP